MPVRGSHTSPKIGTSDGGGGTFGPAVGPAVLGTLVGDWRKVEILMTVTARLTAAQALRRAAARAALAPSIHNSQPWRFILTNGVLELHADRSRQLNVLDPASRQLQISCGCALFNARVALAAAGYASVAQHFPEPARPEPADPAFRHRPAARSRARPAGLRHRAAAHQPPPSSPMIRSRLP